jgi:hypothetical protein
MTSAGTTGWGGAPREDLRKLTILDFGLAKLDTH